MPIAWSSRRRTGARQLQRSEAALFYARAFCLDAFSLREPGTTPNQVRGKRSLENALMANFPRYALYYAAASGSELDRFGANLLGYDAWSGEDLPFPDGVAEGIPDWRDLTQDPRKYGFHATLKAPLALADDKTEAELVAACAAFADTPRTIPVLKPVVNSISGFIAVVPAERSAELERLAGDCVSAFDAFRAPLTPDDRARRNPSGLTPRQCDYLDRWGYPYVME